MSAQAGAYAAALASAVERDQPLTQWEASVALMAGAIAAANRSRSKSLGGRPAISRPAAALQTPQRR